MKHLILKTFIGIFLLTQVACKKDDNTIKNDSLAAKVQQNTAVPVSVTSKDNIVFDITITSESAIKDAVLSLDENDLQTATATAENNQIDLKYIYKVNAQNVGRSLIFRLTITDDKGRVVDKDFTIYIQSAPANISISIPTDAPTEIKDNQKAEYNIGVVSENDIKYIKTFINQTEITALTKETFSNPKQDSYAFSYQPSVADADKTLSFTIEVMDVLGNIKKQDYALKVTRSQVADFNVYPNVNIGAQKAIDAGPFLNASTGEIYATIGSSAKSVGIDFANFFSGSTRAFNIVSPTLATVADNIYTVALFGEDAMANWTTRNSTLIKKLSIGQVEFDLLASASAIEALYTNSPIVASESSGGLANGNVIVFKTASGKYGALYVESRSASANTGYLTVDIKVQK